MSIAILGTGSVGRTLAESLASKGESVTVGTRDVAASMARGEIAMGTDEPFGAWAARVGGVTVATFAEAAAAGEIVINASSGSASLDVLSAAGTSSLDGKIMIDVANPLDFSRGFPPTLSVVNDDSLGEQIQRAYPNARVVKALNTVSAPVMVTPGAIADGAHDLPICGNDTQAKAEVAEHLRTWFGWKRIIDLGDITSARGMEMYLALWVRLMGAKGTPMFNIAIVDA